MCLYPRQIKNRKYQATKKNERISPALMPDGTAFQWYDIPECVDERCLTVEVPCGQCIECREQKASDWRVRMIEEVNDQRRQGNKAYFMTLTFSPEELKILKNREHVRNECNVLPKVAIRRMLERWRKDHKKSLKHWFITEMGHQGTERIHMHGILFTPEELQLKVLEEKKEGVMAQWKYWRYGNVFVGSYVNAKTVNYLMKYITKIDTDHKGFIGEVLCSPGIGAKWWKEHQSDVTYNYRPGRTRTDYILNTGQRIPLPSYYKNHIHTEEEREQIWRDFMDKEQISILGTPHSLRSEHLENITEKAKEINKFLDYGNDSKEWRKREYSLTEKMLKTRRRQYFDKIIEKNSLKSLKNLEISN